MGEDRVTVVTDDADLAGSSDFEMRSCFHFTFLFVDQRHAEVPTRHFAATVKPANASTSQEVPVECGRLVNSSGFSKLGTISIPIHLSFNIYNSRAPCRLPPSISMVFRRSRPRSATNVPLVALWTGSVLPDFQRTILLQELAYDAVNAATGQTTK